MYICELGTRALIALFLIAVAAELDQDVAFLGSAECAEGSSSEKPRDSNPIQRHQACGVESEEEPADAHAHEREADAVEIAQRRSEEPRRPH